MPNTLLIPAVHIAGPVWLCTKWGVPYSGFSNLSLIKSNTDFNIAKKLIGITTQASTYLNSQTVQKSGEITDSSFNFDLNLPIYLGENGLITQVLPLNTCIILGFPLSFNKMYINIQQPIILS